MNTFLDIKPISLSHFVNLIFSRIIHKRIKGILLDIISEKQDGFVQGRSIAENILVVQEIVSEIRKREKPSNMVMNLDIMKEYDKVEWLFLTKVLIKIGFYEEIIDMVF